MKTLLTFLLLIISQFLHATAQIPDILIYNGDTMLLHAVPLNSFPDEDKITPYNLFGSSGCTFTACWRNYVATWEIIDNKLYLTEIRNACYPTSLRGVAASFKAGAGPDSLGAEFADLKELFPQYYVNERVYASWVDYEITAPFGKLLKYFHSGFDSIYEFEKGFEIKNGKVEKIRVLDNRRTRKSKYSIEPKNFDKFLLKKINWSLVQQANLKVKKRVFVIFQTDENGNPINIKIARGINPQIDDEAKRVVGLIRDWDTYFRNGELVKMQWTIPIVFDKEVYEKKIKEGF